jgi:hypothetical protein
MNFRHCFLGPLAALSGNHLGRRHLGTPAPKCYGHFSCQNEPEAEATTIATTSPIFATNRPSGFFPSAPSDTIADWTLPNLRCTLGYFRRVVRIPFVQNACLEVRLEFERRPSDDVMVKIDRIKLGEIS